MIVRADLQDDGRETHLKEGGHACASEAASRFSQ
jgi:hypothetical protein